MTDAFINRANLLRDSMCNDIYFMALVNKETSPRKPVNRGQGEGGTDYLREESCSTFLVLFGENSLSKSIYLTKIP